MSEEQDLDQERAAMAIEDATRLDEILNRIDALENANAALLKYFSNHTRGISGSLIAALEAVQRPGS